MVRRVTKLDSMETKGAGLSVAYWPTGWRKKCEAGCNDEWRRKVEAVKGLFWGEGGGGTGMG